MENPISHVKVQYNSIFKSSPDHVFTSGGRFEVLGNHTDHNHGLCLAATCNLCITAAVGLRNDNIVEMVSEGFENETIDLNSLEHTKGSHHAGEMIKGVANYFVEHGYKIGGMNIYSTSSIFAGAGVSSSAAFLLLIAQLFNMLFNNGEIPTLEMCKAGQYSENNYYEKKSGLLDEIGVAYGNLVSIDFYDIENPEINNIEFPFDDLHFVIINTGGSHSGLNDLYSSIPNDMYTAAQTLGKYYLRYCDYRIFHANPQYFTENQYKRGVHFFTENQRVVHAIQTIKYKDKEMFLKQINESRKSSTENLMNMMIENHYEGSPLEACDRAMEAMDNEGACKINGGGFAGSIICVVPETKLSKFFPKMVEFYGKENVVEVFIRTSGPKMEE